jgi:hypothetical protein
LDFSLDLCPFHSSCQPFGPEPFGNELPSGLSLRVEDKAELLTVEGLSAFSDQLAILMGAVPPIILICLEECFVVKKYYDDRWLKKRSLYMATPAKQIKHPYIAINKKMRGG